MTLSQINAAARMLRKEHPSLTWVEAVTWAGQCWREAQEKDSSERQAFFEARKQALRAEEWLEMVRTAKQRPHDSWSTTERQGGLFAGDCVQYQPARVQPARVK